MYLIREGNRNQSERSKSMDVIWCQSFMIYLLQSLFVKHQILAGDKTHRTTLELGRTRQGGPST